MTLRTRLLIGLLLLSAVGLAVAGVVTYRQTRADLTSRVDRQLTLASQQPDLFFHREQGPDTNLSDVLLPPGTWAQLRVATTGEVLDTNAGSLRDTPPSLPKTVQPGSTFVVKSPHYRVRVSTLPQTYRVFDPSSLNPPQFVSAYLIVAIPLADVDHTLHHLFVVELSVMLGIFSPSRSSRSGS